ncbi:acyl-CoA thioester hydrolase/BAAT C-terminal domain-containing protein [Actinokineospora sp. 24-640]
MRKRSAALAAVVAVAGLSVAVPAEATGPTVHMPASALADETFTTRVTGLDPNETVTITAEMFDDFVPARKWVSEASFVADGHGVVNLRRDAPLPGGSYTDDDEMGLFYSMRIDGEDDRADFGFNKFNATATAYAFTFKADGTTFATHTFEQRYAAPGVTRTEIDTAGVKGFLHLPATPPSPVEHPDGYPAVLAITGSDGGPGIYLEARSALLASHGYVVLNLPYFNHPGLPPTLENIPLEYFGNAVDWLQAHPWVDPERVGMTGASRGGEASLLVAAHFPDIKAVVASTPIGYSWPNHIGTEGTPPVASWTLGGQPVPFVDLSGSAGALQDLLVANRGTDNLVSLNDWALDATAIAPNLPSAAIPVEQNTDCEYLLIMGDDDQLWPSHTLSQVSKQRMEDAGLESNIDFQVLSDAGHIALVPNQPTTYDHYFLPMPYGVYFDLGGTVEGNHRANRIAWSATLEFLAGNL